jgi:hypothetical protein
VSRDMVYAHYQHIRIAVADRIGLATIDDPPINLLDLSLILELTARSATSNAANCGCGAAA